MKLRTRRIFFWALIPCFLVGGAAAVLYSQGYRVGADARSLAKVGALFVRGYPRSAAITLDGAPLDTGSWWPLQSGTFVASLVPGTYRLRASADGYRTWEADVAVRPSLVAERKSLVLFPEDAMPVPLASPIAATGVEVDEDGNLVVTGTDADGATTTLVGAALVPGGYLGTAGGRTVTATERATTTLLRFQAPGSGQSTTTAIPGSVIGFEGDAALVRAGSGLVVAYDARTARREVVASSSGEIGLVLRADAYDAWTEVSATSSALFVRRGTGAARPIPLPPAAAIAPSGSLLGVLGENGSLWLVDTRDGSSREVGHRAGFASWTADGSSVAAVIDGQLEVIPLRTGAPAGKLAGILPPKAEVRRIAWYPDGEHLFVETGDELLLIDVIDGGPGEQHAYRLPRPADWAFSSQDLALYLLDDEGAVTAYAFPD